MTTLDEVKVLILQWVRWRKSDSVGRDLWYASQSAEQSINSGGRAWKGLPDWKVEMAIEDIVERRMKKRARHLYKVLMAVHEIPTRRRPSKFRRMTIEQKARKLRLSRNDLYTRLIGAQYWIAHGLGMDD